MAVPIQRRRDTAANWTSVNPILVDGQQGFETDTLKWKMGDGVTDWNTLPYFSGGAGTGDVVGPGSATDNAVARFDGTTGKIVQNSAVTIADTSGDITAGKYNTVAISGSSTPSIAVTGTVTISGTHSGTSSGTNTGDQTSVTGNAGTATALQTARNINGVSFNGTADITVTAAAGTLTGTTLASGVTASSLTSVGTIATGVWNGTDIAVADGGTGVSTLTAYAPIFGGTTSTGAVQSGTVGSAGQVLTSNGAGALPTFQAPTGGGNVSNTGTPTSGQAAEWTSATVIQGVSVTGSGNYVKANSPTLTTPTLGVASATTVNKVALTAPATGSTLTIADGKTLAASNTVTFSGTDGSTVAFGGGGTVVYAANNLSAFASTTSSQLAGVISDETGSGALVFGTTPTLATPVINGLPTGTGVSSSATASTLVSRDSNANISVNNDLKGYTTTATSAGTTTLTAASTYLQFFTGTTTQTVQLPVTSTLSNGHQFYIRNNSTGNVTIISSGGNTVRILGAGTRAIVTCINTSVTDATGWSSMYVGINITDGKVLSAQSNLTLAGTDGQTLTVNGSATITNGTHSGTNTGDQTSVTGNAGTATALQTARTINGVSFDGTANITVTAAAGTLTGATLASGVTASSLTSFGASPSLTTPNIGAATATSINGVAISGSSTPSISITGTTTISGTHSGTSSGSNTGDQTITLTGDVTGTGTGSFAATIANSSVSNAKLANMTASTIKANVTGGSAAPTDATLSQVLDLVGSAAQGDILYRGASTWTRLPAGALGNVLISGGSSSNPAWDVGSVSANQYILFDDFTYGTVGTATGFWTVNGSNVSNAGAVAVNRPGILQFTTASTSTGTAFIHNGISQYVFGGGAVSLEFSARPTTALPDGVQTYTMWMGFHDTTSANTATDGAYFLLTSASGNWQTVTAKAGTRTTNTGSVAATNGTWQKFRIDINAACTSIAFYIDGTLVQTHTTNLPDTTSNNCGIMFNILKSLGTTPSVFQLDYVRMTQNFTTSR